MVVIVSGLFFFLALVNGVSHSARTTYHLIVDTNQSSSSDDEPVALENDQRGFETNLALTSSQPDILIPNHLLPGRVFAFYHERSPHFKLHQVLRI